jgi:hypothetical protein
VKAAVTMKAITLIKILRPIFPNHRMQRHLTACAAYEVLDRAFEPYLPALRKRHVLGLAPLPRRADTNIIAHPMLKRVHASVHAKRLS